MSKKCHRDPVVQGCIDILQWWRDHRLEFPHLNDLERNKFCVMTTSVAIEQVLVWLGMLWRAEAQTWRVHQWTTNFLNVVL